MILFPRSTRRPSNEGRGEPISVGMSEPGWIELRISPRSMETFNDVDMIRELTVDEAAELATMLTHHVIEARRRWRP